MAIRVPKRVQDLLNAPQPSVGALLRWDGSGNIVNASVPDALGYTPLSNATDTLTGDLTVTGRVSATDVTIPNTSTTLSQIANMAALNLMRY